MERKFLIFNSLNSDIKSIIRKNSRYALQNSIKKALKIYFSPDACLSD